MRPQNELLKETLSIAKRTGQLKQSDFERVSKTLLRKQWLYSHASQFRRARKQTKKLIA